MQREERYLALLFLASSEIHTHATASPTQPSLDPHTTTTACQPPLFLSSCTIMLPPTTRSSRCRRHKAGSGRLRIAYLMASSLSCVAACATVAPSVALPTADHTTVLSGGRASMLRCQRSHHGHRCVEEEAFFHGCLRCSFERKKEDILVSQHKKK